MKKIYEQENKEFLEKIGADKDSQIRFYTEQAMNLYKYFRISHVDDMKYSAVVQNVAEWYKNKKAVMDVLRKHPYWHEENKAVIFPQSFERDTSEKARLDYLGLCDYVAKKICENGCFWDFLYNGNSTAYVLSHQRIYNDFFKIFKATSKIERTDISIDDLYANALKKSLEMYCKEMNININDGRKTSRVINDLFRKLEVQNKTTGKVKTIDATKFTDKTPDNPRGDSYGKFFAQVADDLNPLTIKRTTVLSVNFLDYATMSNGDNWCSCHYINSNGLFHESQESYSGCYKAGTLSYANDSSTMIFYTLKENADMRKLAYEPKITRQCFHYNPKQNVFIQARLYPAGEHKELRKQYRETVQQILAVCLGVTNLWKTSSDRNKIIIHTHRDALNYRDYEEFKMNWSMLKEYPTDSPTVRIGMTAYGLNTGDIIEEPPYLMTQEGLCQCEECGAVVDPDELYTAYYNDSEMHVCESCLHDGYMYCDECGEYVSNYEMVEVCDDYYCRECMERLLDSGEVIECGECGFYDYANNITSVYNGNELIEVCEDCFQSMWDRDEIVRCEDCESFFYNHKDNVVYVEDKPLCRECFEYSIDDGLIDKCDECGAYVFSENLLEDEGKKYCSDCAWIERCDICGKAEFGENVHIYLRYDGKKVYCNKCYEEKKQELIKEGRLLKCDNCGEYYFTDDVRLKAVDGHLCVKCKNKLEREGKIRKCYSCGKYHYISQFVDSPIRDEEDIVGLNIGMMEAYEENVSRPNTDSPFLQSLCLDCFNDYVKDGTVKRCAYDGKYYLRKEMTEVKPGIFLANKYKDDYDCGILYMCARCHNFFNADETPTAIIDDELYCEKCTVFEIGTGHFRKCPHCGMYHRFGNLKPVKAEKGNLFICEKCYEKERNDNLIARCADCGTSVLTDIMFDVVAADGIEFVCADCIENKDRYGMCDLCGEYHHAEDLVTVGDKKLCTACCEKIKESGETGETEVCAYCMKTFYKKDMANIDGEYYCDDCLLTLFHERTIGRCTHCGELHDSKNLVTATDNRGIYITVCKDCFDGIRKNNKE